jgi:hypothetical protein
MSARRYLKVAREELLEGREELRGARNSQLRARTSQVLPSDEKRAARTAHGTAQNSAAGVATGQAAAPNV